MRRIVSNKSTLIKHALNTDSLDIVVTDDKIEFQWFTLIEDGDSAAYMQFIPMLCEFAKVRKRVVAKSETSAAQQMIVSTKNTPSAAFCCGSA